MRTAAKRATWVAVLIAAALVAILAPPQDNDEVALAPRKLRAAATVESDAAATATATASGDTAGRPLRSTEPEVLLVKPRVNSTEADDVPPLFSVAQWAIPAPVAPAAASAPAPALPQAPAPQAPALPFRVIGRYDDGASIAVFLQQNDRNLVVHVGDVVDAVYKVERLDGGTLTLRYLPLNQLQSLDIGSAL